MTEIQAYPPEKQMELRKESHASHKQPQEERPFPTHSPADVQGHFLDTDLIVMWWQLVQKLLYARFFSRAVDIGNLVLGQAAVVLVNLGSKRGDCSGVPWPSPRPCARPAATPQGTKRWVFPKVLSRETQPAAASGLFSFVLQGRGVAAPARWAHYRLLCQPP